LYVARVRRARRVTRNANRTSARMRTRRASSAFYRLAAARRRSRQAVCVGRPCAAASACETREAAAFVLTRGEVIRDEQACAQVIRHGNVLRGRCGRFIRQAVRRPAQYVLRVCGSGRYLLKRCVCRRSVCMRRHAGSMLRVNGELWRRHHAQGGRRRQCPRCSCSTMSVATHSIRTQSRE